MRVILILIVAGLLMVLAGWLTIVNTGNQTSINIETKRIERDTDRALERGREALHNVERGTSGAQQQTDEVIIVPAEPIR